MMYHGIQGYRENARKITEACKKVVIEINKIPEFEIMGEPKLNTAAFRFKKNVNLKLYSIQSIMKEKGWQIAAL